MTVLLLLGNCSSTVDGEPVPADGVTVLRLPADTPPGDVLLAAAQAGPLTGTRCIVGADADHHQQVLSSLPLPPVSVTDPAAGVLVSQLLTEVRPAPDAAPTAGAAPPEPATPAAPAPPANPEEPPGTSPSAVPPAAPPPTAETDEEEDEDDAPYSALPTRPTPKRPLPPLPPPPAPEPATVPEAEPADDGTGYDDGHDDDPWDEPPPPDDSPPAAPTPSPAAPAGWPAAPEPEPAIDDEDVPSYAFNPGNLSAQPAGLNVGTTPPTSAAPAPEAPAHDSTDDETSPYPVVTERMLADTPTAASVAAVLRSTSQPPAPEPVAPAAPQEQHPPPDRHHTEHSDHSDPPARNGFRLPPNLPPLPEEPPPVHLGDDVADTEPNIQPEWSSRPTSLKDWMATSDPAEPPAPVEQPDVSDRPPPVADRSVEPTMGGAPGSADFWRRQQQKPASSTVLGVSAAKGGVGKTTLTLWIAEALTAAGEQVALVDGNIGRPDLAKKLQVWEPTGGMSQLIRGERVTSEALEEVLVPVDGLGVLLPGPPEPISTGASAALAALVESVSLLRLNYRWVLVDTPVATTKDPIVTTLLQKQVFDRLVVVVDVADQVAAVHGAVQFLGELSQPVVRGGFGWPSDRVATLLNRVGGDGAPPMEDLHRWFGSVPIAGQIPHDPEFGAAADRYEWGVPQALQQAVADFTATSLGVNPAGAAANQETQQQPRRKKARRARRKNR